MIVLKLLPITPMILLFQSNLISSGVSAVAAAPSFDSLRELLGNVYTSHLVYARKRATVMFDEEGDTSSMNQSTCPITFDNSTFDAINHFQSIFFGDFAVFSPGYEIEGPLAVGGSFLGSNYTINSQADQLDCSSTNNNTSTNHFADYGVVVAGPVSATDIKINGNAYLGNGTAHGVSVLQPSCNVTITNGTGDLDFEALKYVAMNVSYYLANQNPTMVLDGEGNLSYILNDTNITSNNPYNSIKFDSCSQPGQCGVSEDGASSPQAIFFANGTWNGTQGESFPIERPFVLNIPVSDGTTLTMNTSNPGIGLAGCKTIYHVYPVDEQGQYLSNGTFTFDRETQEYITGVIFAPRAIIMDGASGGFQGQLIASTYSWITNITTSIKAFDNSTCLSDRQCFPFDSYAGDNGGGQPSSNNATTTTTTATAFTTVGTFPVSSTSTAASEMSSSATTTEASSSGVTVPVNSTTVIGGSTVVAGTTSTVSSSMSASFTIVSGTPEVTSGTLSATSTKPTLSATTTSSSATEVPTVLNTTIINSTTVVPGASGSSSISGTDSVTTIEPTATVPGSNTATTATGASVTEGTATTTAASTTGSTINPSSSNSASISATSAATTTNGVSATATTETNSVSGGGTILPPTGTESITTSGTQAVITTTTTTISGETVIGGTTFVPLLTSPTGSNSTVIVVLVEKE